MNNNYNYNFNPNPSYTRNIPISNYIMQMPPNNQLPRISTILNSAKTGLRTNPSIISGLGQNTSILTGTPKITFSTVLNGASKTLGVINQAIPVFYQVKPVWNNAKTMFRVVKEINTKDTPNTKNSYKENTAIKENKKKEAENAPTFFV